MRSLTIEPRGAFDPAPARDFAWYFPAGIGATATAGSILMTFPVEDWSSSAVVELRQDADGILHGEVWGDGELDVIGRQAARSLPVDHDGSAWPEVGRREPVVGALQDRHGLLRAVCVFAAYEAATSFMIGQR